MSELNAKSAARSVVSDLLKSSKEQLDKTFTKGYAEKHPELVGTLVQAAVTVYTETLNIQTKAKTK